MIKLNKPIIGIVSQSYGFDDDALFKDRYYILDNYPKCLVECDAIPIGIVFNNLQVIPENLKICDGFLLTGGIRIDNYHLQIIDYAIKNKIPILGICCGMQAMAMYSLKEQTESNVLSKINSLLSHDSKGSKQDKGRKAHKIKIIDEDSWLYKLFQQKVIEVNSYHNYQINNVGSNFKITALSEDGIIEAIEYNNNNQFVLGVQWHPELLREQQVILKKFISEARKYHENKY